MDLLNTHTAERPSISSVFHIIYDVDWFPLRREKYLEIYQTFLNIFLHEFLASLIHGMIKKYYLCPR